MCRKIDSSGSRSPFHVTWLSSTALGPRRTTLSSMSSASSTSTAVSGKLRASKYSPADSMIRSMPSDANTSRNPASVPGARTTADDAAP